MSDIPTSPIAVKPKTAPGTTFDPKASPPAFQGKGPGYVINPDGSTTWLDALGNPITDIAAYNAAVVGPGDTGLPAMSESVTVSTGMPSWALPAGVGLLLFGLLMAGAHR